MIGNTEGTAGIFVTAPFVCKFLLISLPGKEFVCKLLQFSVYMNVQDSSVFYIDLVSDSVLKEFDFCTQGAFSRDWKSQRTSLDIKALLAVINRKDVFAILPTRHRRSNLVDPWCWQIPVPDRLFIPSPCHNFGCMYSGVSGGLSHSRTAKPWHLEEDVNKHHLLKEAYAFLFGGPEAFLQNEKWSFLLHNMFNKPNLHVRWGWKHSREHAHWSWPSRPKDATLHHLSGNISGW